MQRTITQIGNPVLRQRAAEISREELLTGEMQQLIDDMIETKRGANGAGIAANQVNELKRIFVVENCQNPRYPYKPEYPLTVMVNPQVEFLTEARFPNYEGCLSIPNLRGVVSRCPHVRVSGWDREGKPVLFEVKGISAGTFQHELDHLDGILFPDRVSDPKTFCTWEEFRLRYEAPFKLLVDQIVQQYGM
jgi:peptide deformylase